MSENIPSGHGINIRNFKRAIKLSEDFGKVYDPCNEQLKIPAMLGHLRTLLMINENFNTLQSECKALIQERELIFKSLNKKVTKLCAIAGSLRETEQFRQEVKVLAHKIRGFRSKKTDTLNNPLNAESADTHLSYATRTENFRQLIFLLSGSELYRPNEQDFRIENLMQAYETMYHLNREIDLLSVRVNNARTKRNIALYDAENGVLEIMKACRSYVKGLFGAGSSEYKKFSAIKFRVLPKKYHSF